MAVNVLGVLKWVIVIIIIISLNYMNIETRNNGGKE